MSLSASTAAPDNPFLAPLTTPHRVPPFDRLAPTHYLPAIEAAITEARANIEQIKNNPDAPNFDNTIVALELAADRLGLVTSVFYNQLSAMGGEALEELAEQIGPITARFSADISLDPALFNRVRAVHAQMEALHLTPEQRMLLEDTYKGFVRNGAGLGDNAQQRLRAIDERLSVLAPQFQKNVKKSTERFELMITNPDDLAGLPETARAAAALAAQEKGHTDAWLFTLEAPSFIPFITYADNRPLREKIWRAFNSRAWGDEFDNSTTIKEIVTLKAERAKLLGYANHAAFTLAERMASTPERVFDFIHDLIDTYKPAAEKDLDDLREVAHEYGWDPIQPWDIPYTREKLQQRRFHFDSEELRPYFPLQKVLTGTFAHFEKLFGVRFVPAPALPVWHADAQAFEVYRTADDSFVGVLYADFHPRTGKQSGAWMTDYRAQGLHANGIERPIVAIVCNFTKPTADTPALLTHDEVTTLFHEMGHAMHMMMSNVTYASQAGTSVKWDFVELPSQIQENWAYEPETLAMISGHIETGEPVPTELIDKLRAARNYMAGMNGLRQMSFSLLDMVYYTTDPQTITDLAGFEDKVLADYTLFPRLAGPVSPSFGHIFGGGYAAGYYSYKWAEVLDADAFAAFKAQGLYDPVLAQSYVQNILAKGGSEDPNILYARFRGRAADSAALLAREGLSRPASAQRG